MRSIRAFFREEVARKKQIVAQELTPADEEAEFQRCSALNEDWNLEIARKRDERIAKENAERAEFIKGRLEEKVIRDRIKMAKFEEIVKKEKENAPSFITSANIDQAIEQALANPVDYNFSIDLQGTMYKNNERPGGKAETKEETS
jgi:small subunit ribosomal protein S26